MVPQFQKDGVSLYHGDALAVLSSLDDNSVDAILTDPPYSSGGSVGVACVRTGHGFIGVELSPEYYAISRQQLEKAQAESVNRAG